MNMYEVIINILDQKGPVSIPSLCQEINQNPIFMDERDKPVQQSHIKSVISRKKDLFAVENDIVSLLPEKDFMALIVRIGYFRGPWIKIEIDFVKKTFLLFEMNLEPVVPQKIKMSNLGTTDDFKQALYRLKLWDWNTQYDADGIILDGISWSIVLTTKSKIYRSEGLQRYPKEWPKFCQELTKLTGINFYDYGNK